MSDLKIDVSDLLKSEGAEKKLTFAADIEEVGLAEENVQLASPTKIEVTLASVRRRVLAKGKLKVEARLACGRCLKEFLYPVSASFSELFGQPAQFEEEEPADVEEKKAFSIRDDQIDLSYLVRQTILLSFPMKPLCQELCRGLCPVCGKDLNLEPHVHEGKAIDPRLAPLKKLLKKR